MGTQNLGLGSGRCYYYGWGTALRGSRIGGCRCCHYGVGGAFYACGH